jgi:hypothetical protein
VYGGINEDPATGQLYVTVASHCDFGRYHGTTDQIDTATGAIVHRFYPATRNVVGGGIWGPGGAAIDLATHHVFVATGNALTNPESFHYSEDVVELGGSLKVLGANYPGLIGGDVDFGATPILYQAPGCPPQVAAKNKSGVFVVYTRGDVSSGPTQRLQVASVDDYQFNGIPAYSPRDRTIYIGNSSDTSDPQAPYRHGMVALKVQPDCSLALAWQKRVGPNFSSVSPPTVANGVVYYGDGYGNTEYAFDSTTGRMLWNSGASIGGGLYAAPTVVNGTLYVPSWDHAMYAFTP